MAAMPAKKTTVAVVGDVTVNWMLSLPDSVDGPAIELAWAWGTGHVAGLSASVGGAAELHRLALAATADVRPPVKVVGPRIPARVLTQPGDGTFAHSHTAWAPFRRSADQPGEKAWRIASYLGDEPPARGSAPAAVAGAGDSDVLAIVDMHLGFGDDPRCWPAGLHDGRRPRDVLLIASSPLARGPLWERLVERHADELTVFVLVEELRKDSLPVGYALSWEQVYRDVVDAVRGSDLAKARRVIVLTNLVGAVVIERDGPTRMLFHPRAQERDLVQYAPGRVIGYVQCVAAAVLREMVRSDDPDVEDAVHRGLTAARALHLAGYEPGPQAAGGLGLPLTTVARAIKGKPEGLSAVSISFESGGDHRILTEVLGESNLERIAERAAVEGPDKLLAGIPVETVGAWSSVDRDEIESMRSVRGIMAEYVNSWKGGKRLERPLSIAVFGPPGAGKSFAVKQIAGALLPGELKTLEFNLSQFHDPEELPASFHRVRDLVLQQYLPLVFWDEFDTALDGAPLGWLRHFLAPMQDGLFREAGAFHPIGPAVFVYAGGTCATLREFVTAGDEAAAKNAKKPDFLSRLRGFVNVYGPNQLGENDSAYLLRRAFLLRSLVTRKAPQTVSGGRLQIDAGVLRAFLRVDRYTHGARSLEAIIDMSALAGRPRFERASLPPRQQLALHVDARQFLELVRG
jgi:hypothetical protein